MIIKWTKKGKLTKIISVDCVCGVHMDSVVAISANVIASTAKIANGTTGPHKYRYNVDFKFCPSCAEPVSFSEQILVDKDEYAGLKGGTRDLNRE